MPKKTPEAPVDAVADEGHFATMPKDIGHVTFYFDLTPDDREDSKFFYVKVDTPPSASDDLDTWYDAALAEIMARNAEVLEGAQVNGVAIKYGSQGLGAGGGGGGEFYYKIDGDSTDVDSPPGASYVQARDFNSHGVTYSYGDLFG